MILVAPHVNTFADFLFKIWSKRIPLTGEVEVCAFQIYPHNITFLLI